MREACNRLWLRRTKTLLCAAIVIDVVNHSIARYASDGHREAVFWLGVDLVLFAAVARGSRVAWRLLSGLTAFGAVVFLAAGIGEHSGFQLPRALLFTGQLLLLLSPAVRTRVGLSSRRRRADSTALDR